MRDDTKNNIERKVQITKFREREPTTEQEEKAISIKSVILTVISVRDRNTNTSE